MAIAQHSILINAPADKIYEWVLWSPNLVEVWPNVIRSVSYERDENGMGRHEVIYMMAGFKVKTKSQDTVHITNERIVAHTVNGIKSELTYDFTEEDGGTRLSFSAEYSIPLPIIGGLAENIVLAMNANDLAVMLNNLRIKMEKLYGS